ncbi:RagB/SusD family nutrient uptake outer membrane protein [Solitalea lacus]|uniref:RagB/SusD family nutrient uptake outer membrane protein n=1 Tax=Solitalea lacus TaxID=2911172 RepID=UPI001EDAE496|nr:RagB/SusD family nutrient uptake outer membrane protein [Solitalea lacus]UKJ09274.1 RagB/SusD family nutrient uptake outer membrane protein [Solitalea lacus]
MNQLTKQINKVSTLVTSGCFMFGAITLTTLSGCEKFLEMPLKDKVPQESVFSDEQGFMDALTGVYLGMDKPQNGPTKGLYTNDLSVGALSVMSNNYSNASSSAISDGMYANFAKYDYNQAGVKQEIAYIWSGMYNNVANLNNLLEHIDAKESVFTRDHYARVKGEALALRAFFHFDLARLYGKSPVTGMNEKAIPYVTKFGSSSVPFVTLNTALESCISDLNEAKSLLAKADTASLQEGSLNLFAGYTQNHMNYWATKALLARAYMYKGDYANAWKNAAEVIGSNKFPLSTSNVAVSTNTTRDRLFSKELVFAVYSANVGSINDGMFNLSTGTSLQFTNKTTLYSTGDWRLSWFDKNNVNTEVPSKYFQNAGLPYIMQNIVPLIRISEMYYIAAECANNNGDLAQALVYLNKVRNARGLSSLTSTDASSSAALSLEITKEYKKEFFQEGQTFFYYKRLNKDLKAETGTTVNVPADAYVFPIPDKEVEYN